MERTTLAPIINVDLILKLRIAGHGDDAIVITTDEGDGYSVSCNKEFTDNGTNPTKEQYDEWIGQLETIVTYLNRLKEKV